MKTKGGQAVGNSILVALNDSASSVAVVDFLANLAIGTERVHVTLLHVLIKPSAGDELMGKRFMKEQPKRIERVLERAKDKLIQSGLPASTIETRILSNPCETVADGIIDVFDEGRYDMVVIGRKKMSKAQEFVLGDPSIRLVRALEGTAILVVKTT